MFKENKRYVTKGINENLDIRLQLIMWNLIDELKKKVKVDYLQIFRLSKVHGSIIKITHEQEVPQYKDDFEFEIEGFVLEHDAKVYVIEEVDDISIMLLAKEY
ncbi:MULTISPECIES: DUF960 family protein [Clostridium]|uniref:DUF960 family protein n=1 Tax=Clostridium sp. 3-3 TaxID=2070757 RepID=UPI000CDAAA34|nr:DUF960 family protein [Clostridium sp. 3-3]POO86833.1 hypothetical protein C1H59_08705 [Clostridium sp. 3-3]